MYVWLIVNNCIYPSEPLDISQLWWRIVTPMLVVPLPLTTTSTCWLVTMLPPIWSVSPFMPVAAVRDLHAPPGIILNIPICVLHRKFIASTNGSSLNICFYIHTYFVNNMLISLFFIKVKLPRIYAHIHYYM